MRKFIIILVATAFLLTGCFDMKEINERNFVLTLAMDKSQLVTIYMDIANNDTIVSNTGATFNLAVENSEKDEKNSMYFGHTKVLIFTKDALENGTEIIKEITKNSDFSLKAIVLYCESDPQTTLETIKLNSKEDGLYLWNYFNNKGETRHSVNLKELEESITSSTKIKIPVLKSDGTIEGEIIFDGNVIN